MLNSCTMGYSRRLGPPSEGGCGARSLGGPFSSTSCTSASKTLLSLSDGGGGSSIVPAASAVTTAFSATLQCSDVRNEIRSSRWEPRNAARTQSTANLPMSYQEDALLLGNGAAAVAPILVPQFLFQRHVAAPQRRLVSFVQLLYTLHPPQTT